MDTISISTVASCHTCPLRSYLEQRTGHHEPERYTVVKQIAFHLGTPLDAAMIWREVQLVRPDIDPAMEEVLNEWVDACAGTLWQKAAETDVRVASRELGIHGVIDRLFEEEPWFAITRSTEAPKLGIYTTDRIRVACYSACIRESLGIEVNGGLVEYVPSGTARLCTLQPRDRRATLRALATAQRTARGEVPRRPRNAPCDRCHLQERCQIPVKRLTDFF